LLRQLRAAGITAPTRISVCAQIRNSKQPTQRYQMNIKKFAVTAVASAIALVALAAPLPAAQLTDQNKQFLAAYDKVHHALVADDLATAKKAAMDLGTAGAELSKSNSLEEARTAFSKLSDQAEKLAAGQPGYYVMYCPMKKKDWVQTSEKVENPYGGKDMLTCGELKK
jgi:hypothetical protein